MLLAIQASGDFAALLPGVIEILQKAAHEGEIVDVIQVQGDDGVSGYMRQETKPFYKRKRFGWF